MPLGEMVSIWLCTESMREDAMTVILQRLWFRNKSRSLLSQLPHFHGAALQLFEPLTLFICMTLARRAVYRLWFPRNSSLLKRELSFFRALDFPELMLYISASDRFVSSRRRVFCFGAITTSDC